METLSPFDSMPNELISMILKEAVETYSFNPEAIYVAPQTDINILASVLFVCKRWAHIMLNEPGVWASAIDVDCSDLGSIQDFARLAKKTPLAILSDTTFDWPDVKYDKGLLETPSWAYVFMLIQRWGVFSLWASIDADNTNPLVHALTHPAPNLESFQIYNIWYPKLDESSVDDFNNRLFVLPDNLFSGQSPRLKKFAITDAYLRSTFNFAIWADVTELYVDFLLGGLQGDKISSRQWLDVLRDMKQLQILSLGWTYSGNLDDIVDLLPRDSDRNRGVENMADVHLDHLQSLMLLAECEWNIMFDLFPKLVVPDTCCTSITLGHTHGRAPQFDWLTVGLDRRVAAWKAAVDTPFRICLINIHGSEFGFEIDVDTQSVQTMGHTFKFTHEDCSHDDPSSELNDLDLVSDFHEMSRVLQPILESSVVQFFEGEDEDSQGEGGED
ncbi:hypothetical protein BJ912DRAFT_1049379 [Pholiota molesta]|nr:hypothetical protein BJ912DRAFT_1049379 [Pholiota molesta]